MTNQTNKKQKQSLGTFIKPGSFARLSKYNGDMVDYGDNMDAILDAQAAQFVTDENGRMAHEHLSRLKVEKARALAERAIVMRETALVLGEGFDVPDMGRVEERIGEAREEGRRMAEEAAERAGKEAERRLGELEARVEERLRVIEEREKLLERREVDVRMAGRDAETQKVSEAKRSEAMD